MDASRPIRCFGQPINGTTFVELTGQQWSHLGNSGPYCPAQASPSIYVQGGVSVGFRPVASGQLFQVFLPVVSSQQLIGASAAPPDAFRWATTATGVYANPGVSTVWANVFPDSNLGQSPFVYFAREPAAVPFWKADAPITPVDTRNRAEFFANFYTAGLGGVVSYEIRRTDNSTLVWNSAMDGPNFNGTVTAGLDLVQILPDPAAKGPNGGYVPVSFDPPGEWDVPMRITWSFDPDGAAPPVTKSADFRTLSGPDTDGDGVADAADACPAAKGTLANGCLPGVETDSDGDGVFGAADKCPTVDGRGTLDGCPVAAPLPTPPAPLPTPPALTPALGAKLGLRAGATLKRAALAKGLPVKVTCTRDARATLTLRLAKRTAAKLGLRSPTAGVVVATGAGGCRAGVAVSLKLTSKRAVRARLARIAAAVPATLTVAVTAAGSPTAVSTLKAKLR